VKRIKSVKIPEAAETIMSIAERIRVSGREEGFARGREEGIVRGTLIGRIQALQGILKRPESTSETLEALGADQLRAMIAELERALR
jgi:predicted transposase YdaD